MRKYDVTVVLDGIERHLRFEPMKESRSRIKKLKGRKPPADYRLRVDDWRVFYVIYGNQVDVLRVLHKDETKAFYG
ncbi:MAG: type II toxin-antitoxin system RelE/ParE family toxin [Deltaproteobacteria bacterium]|nr:type II toxin-antitoxin system RelE/ParE family toxin [Deltaproteobacteria bacterium]